jgi:hypothetical protein
MISRKKPSVAFWATVALVVVLVGYPLSFGPACWLVGTGVLKHDPVLTVYKPIVRLSVECGQFGYLLARDLEINNDALLAYTDLQVRDAQIRFNSGEH